jgi:hypothetical protein
MREQMLTEFASKSFTHNAKTIRGYYVENKCHRTNSKKHEGPEVGITFYVGIG